MPLKIMHKREDQVPTPDAFGRVNEDLINLRSEMAKLGAGMVLEIDAGSEKGVRGTKMLVTKAANQLGTKWRHWNVGTSVFAKPAEATRRRGRRPKSES